MMSPEPPREEAVDNTESSDEVETIIMFNTDDLEDIMGDGEHELDYSNPDSDNDESDEEDGGQGHVSHPHPTDNDGDPAARGHYQLLIPFPPSENHSDSEMEFRHRRSSVDANTNLSRPENSATSATTMESVNFNADFESANPMPETELSSRGIQLTTERSEAIRNAMKGISLPLTAIPEWAKEVSDDVWQRRLSEALDKKRRQE